MEILHDLNSTNISIDIYLIEAFDRDSNSSFNPRFPACVKFDQDFEESIWNIMDFFLLNMNLHSNEVKMSFTYFVLGVCDIISLDGFKKMIDMMEKV